MNVEKLESKEWTEGLVVAVPWRSGVKVLFLATLLPFQKLIICRNSQKWTQTRQRQGPEPRGPSPFKIVSLQGLILLYTCRLMDARIP